VTQRGEPRQTAFVASFGKLEDAFQLGNDKWLVRLPVHTACASVSDSRRSRNDQRTKFAWDRPSERAASAKALASCSSTSRAILTFDFCSLIGFPFVSLLQCRLTADQEFPKSTLQRLALCGIRYRKTCPRIVLDSGECVPIISHHGTIRSVPLGSEK
jgi:hypothetical protein